MLVADATSFGQLAPVVHLQHADIALSAKSILLNPNWVEDVRARKKLPLYAGEDANRAYGEGILP